SNAPFGPTTLRTLSSRAAPSDLQYAWWCGRVRSFPPRIRPRFFGSSTERSSMCRSDKLKALSPSKGLVIFISPHFPASTIPLSPFLCPHPAARHGQRNGDRGIQRGDAARRSRSQIGRESHCQRFTQERTMERSPTHILCVPFGWLRALTLSKRLC